MRASPPFQVTIAHHGVWRAALVALLALTATALATWLALGEDIAAWFQASAAGAGLVILGTGATLFRIPAKSLRWDTQRWHLGPAASIGEEPWPGALAVCLDLGNWMLLRFDHEAGRPVGRRTTWLPIQRRGLESEWHALRCAVYCARPETGADNEVVSLTSQNSNNERP